MQEPGDDLRADGIEHYMLGGAPITLSNVYKEAFD
jgi:hypothetical protein